MLCLVFLFVAVLCMASLLFVGSFERLIGDAYEPINYLLFPKLEAIYPLEIVNLWIDKSWDKESVSRIPCRVESFSQNDELVIIYAHSSFENLTTASFFIRELSNACKCTVVTFDYSGFGKNKYDKFERTAKGINATLRCVYDHFNTQQVCLLGYSIGAGPCIQLAKEIKNSNLCTLTIIGAFSSLQDLIREQTYGIFGQSTSNTIADLVSERWNNASNLAEVNIPVLIVHAVNDKVVPLRHSLRLRKSKTNADFQQISGDHEFAWGEVIKTVKEWLFQNELIVD